SRSSARSECRGCGDASCEGSVCLSGDRDVIEGASCRVFASALLLRTRTRPAPAVSSFDRPVTNLAFDPCPCGAVRFDADELVRSLELATPPRERDGFVDQAPGLREVSDPHVLTFPADSVLIRIRPLRLGEGITGGCEPDHLLLLPRPRFTLAGWLRPRHGRQQPHPQGTTVLSGGGIGAGGSGGSWRGSSRSWWRSRRPAS